MFFPPIESSLVLRVALPKGVAAAAPHTNRIVCAIENAKPRPKPMAPGGAFAVASQPMAPEGAFAATSQVLR